MNWLDLLLLWLIIWSAWKGIQAGLIASLARICGLLLGLVLAREYHRPLAEYIGQHWPVNQWLGNWSAPPASNYINETLSEWYQHLSRGAPELLSFIAILVLTAWLISWLGNIVGAAAGIGLLGPVNRAGGLILGIARGILAAVIFLAVLMEVKDILNSWLPGFDVPWLDRALNSSRLYQALYPAKEILQKSISLLNQQPIKDI
ncbi:CvpA family protein [Desulfofundulus thermocisternus]|uniref:CvpA family protein n=1 Tax=Desulfofundulus thermocisternus TaxID=42471 RepID=UPI0019DB24C5|nr:CvpA family protein [Desulfofundulus thermocisternus]MBE3586742.1 CvpA family protein [Thermoanaerobacter sp.]MCS5697038.1 CvpA family protein [Desulfofundulus thermocisternus]